MGPNIIEKVGCELVESARNGWQLVGSPALGGKVDEDFLFVRDFAHAVCAVCGVTNGVGALPIVVERCVGAYEGVGTQKQARGEVFVLVKHALGKSEAAHDATFKDVAPACCLEAVVGEVVCTRGWGAPFHVGGVWMVGQVLAVVEHEHVGGRGCAQLLQECVVGVDEECVVGIDELNVGARGLRNGCVSGSC